MEFLGIEFTEGESLTDFADQFYASCQYLSGVGSLSEYDSKIAMSNALKPYHEIHIAMLPALVNNYKPINLVQYLKRIGQEFGPPKLSQYKAKSNQLSKENSVTSYKLLTQRGITKKRFVKLYHFQKLLVTSVGKRVIMPLNVPSRNYGNIKEIYMW